MEINVQDIVSRRSSPQSRYLRRSVAVSNLLLMLSVVFIHSSLASRSDSKDISPSPSTNPPVALDNSTPSDSMLHATSTELDVHQGSISTEPIAQDVQGTSSTSGVSLSVTNDFSPDDLGFFYNLEVYGDMQSPYGFELDIPSSWPLPWQSSLPQMYIFGEMMDVG